MYIKYRYIYIYIHIHICIHIHIHTHTHTHDSPAALLSRPEPYAAHVAWRRARRTGAHSSHLDPVASTVVFIRNATRLLEDRMSMGAKSHVPVNLPKTPEGSAVACCSIKWEACRKRWRKRGHAAGRKIQTSGESWSRLAITARSLSLNVGVLERAFRLGGRPVAGLSGSRSLKLCDERVALL